MTDEIASIILRPKKLTSILLLLGSSLFFASCILMAFLGQWIGYFGAAFFGLGIPIAIIQLLPNGSYLHICPDGFIVCNLFRKYTVPWSAVDRFLVINININPMSFRKMKRVGFNLLHSDSQSSFIIEVNKALAQSEAMLPDTYGKKAEELAEIMNACLLRYRAETYDSSVLKTPSSYPAEINTIVLREPEFGNAQIIEIDITFQSAALKLLRPVDYALVILCGSWLMTTLITTGSGFNIPVGIISAFLFFCVYTGWRHVGVIDSTIWKSYIFVFPLLILFCILLLSTTFEKSPSKGKEDAGKFLSILMQLWLIIVSIGGITSIILLNIKRINLLNIRLPKLLSKLKNWRIAQATVGKKPIERVNKRLSIILGAVGIIIILGVNILPIPDSIEPARRILKFYQLLNLSGFFFLVFAQRYWQVKADALLDADKRDVILFLRSFEDDEKQQYKASDVAFLDFSLENRLSKHFKYFGPFLGIGSPNESLPFPGAPRKILSEDDWQSNVTNWINQASIIIMYAGKTHWVNWELAKIIESGRVTNLILMIPEFKVSRRRRHEEVAFRIERVKQVFRSTRWSRSLDGISKLQNLRTLIFCEDGSLIVIKSYLYNRDSYHLAALIAHYIIFKQFSKN